MDEELLRKEIYNRLGVEIGSLSSESGNDWQRAEITQVNNEKTVLYEPLANSIQANS